MTGPRKSNQRREQKVRRSESTGNPKGVKRKRELELINPSFPLDDPDRTEPETIAESTSTDVPRSKKELNKSRIGISRTERILSPIPRIEPRTRTKSKSIEVPWTRSGTQDEDGKYVDRCTENPERPEEIERD